MARFLSGYWLLVLGWMGCIFYLSHQPAQASNSLSGGVMDLFLSFLPEYIHPQLDLLHTIIRKLAHFGAYAILAIFLCMAIYSSKKNDLKAMSKRKEYGLYCVVPFTFTYIALAGSFLYAASDEFHQTFIPGRSGEVRDILLDTFGAFVGIILYSFVFRFMLYRKKQEK